MFVKVADGRYVNTNNVAVIRELKDSKFDYHITFIGLVFGEINDSIDGEMAAFLKSGRLKEK